MAAGLIAIEELVREVVRVTHPEIERLQALLGLEDLHAIGRGRSLGRLARFLDDEEHTGRVAMTRGTVIGWDRHD